MSQSPIILSADPQAPTPPRFRRLKFHAALALILVMLLVAIRWWWASSVDAKTAAFIDAAHARGEKIVRDDYEEPIAPERNASAFLKEAATRIAMSQEQETWQNDFEAKLPLNSTDMAMIRRIATSNRSSIELARRVRAAPQAGLVARLARPAYSTLLPHLHPSRQLTEILRFQAMHEHMIGDDGDALQRVLDGMRIADATSQSAPALVCYLVGIGIHTRQCDLLLKLAPTLDVAQTKTAPATTRPASRQQVLDVIARLLDEREIQAGAQFAWRGERMMVLDSPTSLAPMIGTGWLSPIFEPALKRDALRLARRYDLLAAAATLPSYPTAVAAAPRAVNTTQASRLQQATLALSANLGIDPRRSFTSHFSVLTDRRAAAVMLAMRLYALDHAGALPEKLDGLVPDYLPAVPRDPFAGDGRALAYRTAATRPFVYSVGTNGNDDSGATTPIDQTPKPNPLWRFDLLDAVYFVEPPTTRGSTQPVIQTPPLPVSPSE